MVILWAYIMIINQNVVKERCWKKQKEKLDLLNEEQKDYCPHKLKKKIQLKHMTLEKL